MKPVSKPTITFRSLRSTFLQYKPPDDRASCSFTEKYSIGGNKIFAPVATVLPVDIDTSYNNNRSVYLAGHRFFVLRDI